MIQLSKGVVVFQFLRRLRRLLHLMSRCLSFYSLITSVNFKFLLANEFLMSLLEHIWNVKASISEVLGDFILRWEPRFGFVA